MNLPGVYEKDPAANLDYAVDWGPWLGEDIISTVNWTVPDGLNKTKETKTSDVTVVWLSGGTNGSDYEIGCQVTTADGRIDKRSITIRVRTK